MRTHLVFESLILLAGTVTCGIAHKSHCRQTNPMFLRASFEVFPITVPATNRNSWFPSALPFVRGGAASDSSDAANSASPSSENDSPEMESSSESSKAMKETEVTSLTTAADFDASQFEAAKESSPRRRMRHTSDVISDIITPHDASDSESYQLRDLISTRAKAYVEDLQSATEGRSPGKLPHPSKLLHYVAPKIPAIKHSPDLMLKVQSSRRDIDAGVAACAIGAVARVCELYDKRQQTQIDSEVEVDHDTFSVGSEIVRDRRFEQLVECVLCGMDMNRRKQEAELLRKTCGDKVEEDSRDIEQVLDEEIASIDDGLSVKDACRAAWGIAILGGYHKETIAGEKTSDILSALSLLVREILLARLQLLRQGDASNDKNPSEGELTLLERLEKDAESLAQDAASAMWVFACVKACTGHRSVSLLEACCSILCQNPTELREKAEAERVGLDGSNFAIDDVVERLERSEASVLSGAKERENGDIPAQQKAQPDASSPTITRDSLLDWLSPNEATDVLWSLALHGAVQTGETEAREEVTLSETAAAFREIAFDRLVAWLRHDLEKVQKVRHTGSGFLENKCTSRDAREDVQKGEIVVQVVDAANLLSTSESKEYSTMPGEKIVNEEDVPQAGLKVVDATTLLAAAAAADPVDDEAAIDSDINVAACADSEEDDRRLRKDLSESPTGERKITNDEETLNEVLFEMSDLIGSDELFFSPHDLCSIAWAVTDLRDPLRHLIADLVAEIFVAFGKESISLLSGGDLSNLAWAMARSSTKDTPGAPAVIVTRSIAEATMEKLKTSDGSLKAKMRLLNEFQPPELGRLTWSLAFTLDQVTDPFRRGTESSDEIQSLVQLVLCSAGADVSIFGTEDLVRISWAFLQLSDPNELLLLSSTSDALGRIISVAESSLLLWESGQRVRTTKNSEDDERPDDSLRFSTFFGRSRFSLPILNQRIGEYEVEEGELEPYPLKKASLPLLRDLSVDPSSLCKLAAGCAELGRLNPDVRVGWTFVRVAVRLLASKNGQLMKQCSTRDMIRLCYACAANDINGYEREHVTRLFARRVVQFLNEAYDRKSDDHITSAHRLDKTTSWEMAMLFWSLGELGARHFSVDYENRRFAHRKLHIVTEKQILPDEQLLQMSPEATSRLLHGIVAMNMVASDPSFVFKVLTRLELDVSHLSHGAYLCEVAHALCRILNAIGTAESSAPHKSEQETEVIKDKDERESESESDGKMIDSLPKESEIASCCRRMLAAVAERATEEITKFTAKEMRSLLLVYTVVPFQADRLFDAIKEEVDHRMDALEASQDSGSIERHIRQAAVNTKEACDGLLGMHEGDSTLSAIKNGIKSFFRSSDSDGLSVEAQEVVSQLHHAVASSEKAAGCLEHFAKGAQSNAGTVLLAKQQASRVELARCRELAECYRRVDFHTGVRSTRYDSRRRNVIGKRVLSRLFPQ